jgi:ABC-2 type transport system permease protein
MKIFKRPGTYVMIAILIVITSIAGAFTKYEQRGLDAKVDPKWEQNLKEENAALKKQYDAAPNKMVKQSFKKEIAINEYRLNHHIQPESGYNVWSFVKEVSGLISLAGLFTIIISAGIVASEFNWGTIKLLLIRPINRSKILASKYLTVILFAFLMMAILFVYSTALGAILFGMPEKAANYLNYYNGHITEQNMMVHLIIYYGLNSIDMFMLATMAFMISSVFRNSSLAIGLSIFLLFTGSTLTNLVAMKFDWAKYILFANTNLMNYYDGTPTVEGMTMTFSVVMIIIYFLIFQALAFTIFKKRDVAA